ncbi:MAG TPA: hypothetical protein VGX28_03125 [Frankiaceae bacterium]|jgi:hypothetical protein|nr:hypothetical protein [Frankiaceae bacterium]
MARSRVRALLAAALLAGTTGTAGTAGTAGAAPPAAAPAVTMAGTTTFRSAYPAWVDVRVPADATVATPFGDSPDLKVRGTGRVTTFAMVGQGARAGDTLYGGASWLDGATFLVPKPANAVLGGGSYETVKTYGDVTRVRAGAYRLYLVPDGGAAEVTLTLHGLNGRAAYDLTRRAVGAVDGGVVIGTNPMHASVTREVSRTTFVVHLLRSDVAPVAAAWQVALCYGRDVRSEAQACTGGSQQDVDEHRLPYLPKRPLLFVQAYPRVPPSAVTLSATLAVEGAVTRQEYVSVWVSYA